jgi:hypothetical protein
MRNLTSRIRKLLESTIVLLCLFISSPASGDAGRAREAYALGLESLERGDLSRARSAFEDAYRESPHYVVLFNLARVCFELGDLSAADLSIQRYLKDGGELLTPAERQDADTLRRQIEERLAEQRREEAALEDAPRSPREESQSIPESAPRRLVLPPTHRSTAVIAVRQGERAHLSAAGPMDARRRYAYALGGAGVVLLAASVGLGIYNHARYLEWREGANRLQEHPPPSEVQTQADLQAVGSYGREVGRLEGDRAAIRALDVVVWAGAGLGTALLGTGVVLFVLPGEPSGGRSYAASVSGRF